MHDILFFKYVDGALTWVMGLQNQVLVPEVERLPISNIVSRASERQYCTVL